MKLLFIIYIFLLILISFVQNPKPENVTIYKIDEKSTFYEYKFLKDDSFSFEFSVGRGTCCKWVLQNRAFFNESNSVQFVREHTYDYLSEMCEKSTEEDKHKNCLVGGTNLYYEIFKALKESCEPLTLNYNLDCYGTIYSNITINISVYDPEINKEENICEKKEICEIEENPSFSSCGAIPTSEPNKTICIYDEINNKCMIKKKCIKVDFPSKETCENAIASQEQFICTFDEINNECREIMLCSLVLTNLEINCEKSSTLNIKTKCVYDEKENKCKEENKTCTDFVEEASEELCLNLKTSSENMTCIFNNSSKSCNEIDLEDLKNNVGKNINLCYILLYSLIMIYLI